jgi:hypothetical protein
MLVKIQDSGFRFAEAPVRHYSRSHGKSQFFRARRIFHDYRDLFRFWWNYIVRKNKNYGEDR